MELIAYCEANYVRLAVECGVEPEEAKREWDELIALKEEDKNGNQS